MEMEWKEVGSNTGVYILEYQAKGYARTNCCAIQFGDGYAILSPASNIKEEHLQFIEKRGRILALIPPHSGHTLGILDWIRLRPNLRVYSAPGSVARVKKVCSVEVQPIGELPFHDKNVTISLVPGVGGTALNIKINRGDKPVVYLDEILEDLDRYPGPIFLRPLMKLMKKGPGFQVNRGYIRFFVKNTAELKNEAIRLATPNAHFIFAHGPIRSSESDQAETRRLLNSI
jgi:hypothetical protein